MLALRICLLLLGLLYFAVGSMTAFAGLGLELPAAAAAGESQNFALTNNHYRFFAGVFAGSGVMLLLAAWDLPRFHAAATAAILLVVLGGLARLLDLALVLEGLLTIELVFELLIGAALLFWMSRVLGSKTSARASGSSS